MADRVVRVRLAAQVSDYEKGMLAAARATSTVGSETEKLAQKKQAFEQVGRGLVVTGAALTAVTVLSVKAAMGWESAWAGVTKTVDGSTEEMAALESQLRDLTGILPATHDEIAAVAEAAGQLGVERENVAAFTKTMIDLGETTNLSANDAATSLARFTNIMGTSKDKVDNLGSALVGLGNNYATTEAEIMEMSMRLAGAGKQIGLTEGDVLGLATALSSVGIEAEAGGSAMSKVMIDIASSVEQGGARLELFAKTAGVSADTFAQKWKSDPAAALSLFVKGLSNAETQGSSTLGVLAELGITEVRMRDALLRSASAADEFSGAMARGNEEFEANNALTLEAAKRYETVESKLAIAGNAVRDASINFGQVFLPAIAASAEAVTAFAGFMGDLPDPVQGVIGILTLAVGAIALTGGTALLAVPKIAEFKVALQTLGISMRTIGLVGGGAILALTALVTIVGSVAAAQAAAREKAEAYANTLAEGTHRITKATRELAAENLGKGSQYFFWENPSALDAAESLGVSLDLVTDAALGNADALRQLDRELQAVRPEGLEVNTRTGKDALQAYESKVRTVTDAVKGEAASLDEAARMQAQKAKATEGSVGAAKTAAQAYTEESEAVADLNSQLAGLIDKINAANGIAGDAIVANSRYQSALAGLADVVKDSGSSLDQNTEAGSKNAAALVDVASAAQNAAKAQFEQDKATMSAEDATKKYVETLGKQRDAFIETAVKAGFSRGEVEKLADQIFKLPDAKETKVLVETARAQKVIDGFIRLNDGRRIKIHVDTAGDQSWKVGGKTVSSNAEGGIYHNKVKAFAAGGFEPGIYPFTAGGIHKFAEEYGEAYISMDPRRRSRSEQVWQRVGQELGVTNAGADLGPLIAEVRSLRDALGRPNVSIVNPVSRDAKSDAWDAAQIVGS